MLSRESRTAKRSFITLTFNHTNAPVTKSQLQNAYANYCCTGKRSTGCTGETQVKGRALVVLKFYWKHGKLKAELGVGLGKLAHDKRADLKKRVTDRETAREVARFNRKHA